VAQSAWNQLLMKRMPMNYQKLGQQFVHYAMTDLPLKIEYHPEIEESKKM
jgi:hypothetical protein